MWKLKKIPLKNYEQCKEIIHGRNAPINASIVHQLWAIVRNNAHRIELIYSASRARKTSIEFDRLTTERYDITGNLITCVTVLEEFDRVCSIWFLSLVFYSEQKKRDKLSFKFLLVKNYLKSINYVILHYIFVTKHHRIHYREFFIFTIFLKQFHVTVSHNSNYDGFKLLVSCLSIFCWYLQKTSILFVESYGCRRLTTWNVAFNFWSH